MKQPLNCVCCRCHSCTLHSVPLTTLCVHLSYCTAFVVVQVTAPDDGVDVSRTFEVSLPSRSFTFQMPKPKRLVKKKKQPKQGEEGAGGEDGDSGADAPQGSRPASATAASGAAAAAEGAEAAATPEAVEEEEEVWEEYDDSEGSPFDEAQALEVLTLQYVPGDQDTLRVTLGGKAAGKVSARCQAQWISEALPVWVACLVVEQPTCSAQLGWQPCSRLFTFHLYYIVYTLIHYRKKKKYIHTIHIYTYTIQINQYAITKPRQQYTYNIHILNKTARII